MAEKKLVAGKEAPSTSRQIAGTLEGVSRAIKMAEDAKKDTQELLKRMDEREKQTTAYNAEKRMRLASCYRMPLLSTSSKPNEWEGMCGNGRGGHPTNIHIYKTTTFRI